MQNPQGTNSPFNIIDVYARKLINNEFTTGELKSMFDELSGYRNFFEEYVGEHSDEYRIANALMVLSKNLKSNADSSSVKHWVAKYPLYSVWFERIDIILKSKSKKWKYGYAEAMLPAASVEN